MPDENKLATIEPETREETFLQDIADGTETLIPAVRKEEFLRRIAAKPGVPSITESDEGKVLTVDNGEAVWGEGGGGGGDLFEIVYSPASLTGVTSEYDGLVIVMSDAPAPVYDGPFYAWTVEGVAAQFGGVTYNYLPVEKWDNVYSTIRLDSEEAGNSVYLSLEVNDDGVFQLSAPVYSDGITVSVTGIQIAKSKDDQVEMIRTSDQIQRPSPEQGPGSD